jgi:stress response protein YsnF
MLTEREVSAAIGSTAYGANGDKIGTVEHFFVDDRTGAPTWVSVTTGLFGTRRSVVPAVDGVFDDGSLRLPVTAEAVKSAPHPAGDHLEPAEESELRRHYGLEADGGVGPEHGAGRHHDADPDEAAPAASTQEMPVVPPPPAPSDEAAGSPAAVPTAGATDGGMTRSEEQLRVGTERVATTRARLVKYVVTEDVQITVPIRREEIRVEEVPLEAPDTGPGESLVPGDGSTGPGGAAGGLPDEIVLHAERPVVSVEVVPVERVRLRTELVQGHERVTEQVQREQIVVDQNATEAAAPPR